MNSNENNDMLRAALQRRAERMAPAKGWEQRVIAETTGRQRRRWLKWPAISGAAAAVAAIVIALLTPNTSEPPTPEQQPVIAMTEPPRPIVKAQNKGAAPQKETAEAPEAPAPRRRAAAPKELPEEPAPSTQIDVIINELEIEESMTVEQELAALFAMAETETEIFSAFATSFDDIDPIIFSTYIIELQ